MAGENILTEFFVRLGWRVDNSGTENVGRILRNAQIQAQLAADAIEKIVGKLKDFSEGIASAYEDLYYASQRNRASVENIKAFSYAAANMGSSVGAARDSIEKFGRNLRSNSSWYNVLAAQGVKVKEANGNFRDSVDIITDLGKVLAKRPQQLQLQLADMFGLDEQTLRAVTSPEFSSALDKYRKLIEAGHFDPQAAAGAWKDFNNTFRDFMTTLDLLIDKVVTRLVKEFGPQFRQFVDYLVTHSDQITDAVMKVIDTVIDLAKQGIKYIGESSDFQKSWDSTKKTILHVAEGIMAIVRGVEKLIGFLRELDSYATGFANVLNRITGQPEVGNAGGGGAPASGGGGSGSGPNGGAGIQSGNLGRGGGAPNATAAQPNTTAAPKSPWGGLYDFTKSGSTATAGGGDDDSVAGDLSGQSTYKRKGEPLDTATGAPDGFIVHHTAGRGTPESIINTLNARGLGVQYVMGRDGKIFRALPKGSRAAHILPSEINNLSNDNTVGMEVIANDDTDVTKAQIAAGVAFLKKMKAKYPGLQVFGHGEVNPHHKMASEGKSIVDAFRAAGDTPTITATPGNLAKTPLTSRTLLNFAHGSLDASGNPAGLATAPLTTPAPNGHSNVTLNQKTSIAVDGNYDAHELTKATALSQLKTNGDLLRTMQGAAQ